MSAHRVRFTTLVLVSLLFCLAPGVASAQGKSRAVVIVPYDASMLAADDQWMGEAVAQVLSRGLAQHPGFVEVERAGLDPSAWDEAAVRALATQADVVLFGWQTLDLDASTAPFLAIELKKGDARFSFFTLHELRIECFFAADNATDEALRRLAAVNPPA